MNGVQRVFSISRLQLSVIATALTLVACHTPVTEQPPAPELGSGYRTDLTTRHAERHMAAAANPLAAEAGREMLRQGGSAIDAAIAMQAVLTLVEPQSSGIGGGAFIMLWDGKNVHAYDGRETAPAGATERLFLKAHADGISRSPDWRAVGGHARGVAGVADGAQTNRAPAMGQAV
jgi:gamma-glutamyltranspeptidase/glutathione hydrolase